MKRSAIVLTLLFLPFSFLAQKVKYIAQSPGTFIKIAQQHVRGDESDFLDAFIFPILPSYLNTDTIFVGLDSGSYKAKTEDVLVVLQKDGHRSQTQLITGEKIRRNKKRIILKKTELLPLRNKDGAYILVEQVDLAVKRKEFTEYHYESYKDLLDREIDYTVRSDKDIFIQKTIFRDLMNEFLIKTHYIDPVQSSNFNLFDRIKLKITITTVTEHRYSQFCMIELRCKIKFESPFNEKEVEKEYTACSNINYNINTKILIEEALENVFLAMTKNPELKDYFISPVKALNRRNDSLPIIQIKNSSSESSNLQNASNAIVTIVQKNGHGSGCLISNDGYIITNYRIASLDTSEVFVVFNSGVKKRCRYVRDNPIYDLSLLKADTVVASPIKLNLSEKINVGEEVFAIGTEKIINLGPSIKKAMITAKKTFKDKIYIQFDIKLENTNNSGGALANKEGELIGILNTKFAGSHLEGMSFAVPAYYIEEFLHLKIIK